LLKALGSAAALAAPAPPTPTQMATPIRILLVDFVNFPMTSPA
jgi:hypothetical protein